MRRADTASSPRESGMPWKYTQRDAEAERMTLQRLHMQLQGESSCTSQKFVSASLQRELIRMQIMITNNSALGNEEAFKINPLKHSHTQQRSIKKGLFRYSVPQQKGSPFS